MFVFLPEIWLFTTIQNTINHYRNSVEEKVAKKIFENSSLSKSQLADQIIRDDSIWAGFIGCLDVFQMPVAGHLCTVYPFAQNGIVTFHLITNLCLNLCLIYNPKIENLDIVHITIFSCWKSFGKKFDFEFPKADYTERMKFLANIIGENVDNIVKPIDEKFVKRVVINIIPYLRTIINPILNYSEMALAGGNCKMILEDFFKECPKCHHEASEIGNFCCACGFKKF